MSDRYMVFDVESVGLHGGGFAVGWVVVDDGREVSHGVAACDADFTFGTDENREWVEDHVTVEFNCTSVRAVRDAFWTAWRAEAEQGATLAAEVPWPVEARFLSKCVMDDLEEREWQGPYPLIDIASVIMAKGGDPLAVVDRLPGELPAHNPLADARQSARLLLAALAGG